MDTPGFGIAVAQFAPGADTDGESRRDPRLERAASDRGARLVGVPRVLELLHATRPGGTGTPRRARGRPFTESSSRISTRLDVHIVAGMIERLDGDERRVANTVVAVAPRARGGGALPQAPPLRRVRAARVGLGRAGRARAARDVRARRHALRAADLLRPAVPRGRPRRSSMPAPTCCCVPAEWVRGPLKEHHWRTLVHARAPSRTPCTSPRPTTRRRSGSGNWMIVDPQGVELAAIGDGHGCRGRRISTASASTRVRRVNPALALRRFDVTARLGPRQPAA